MVVSGRCAGRYVETASRVLLAEHAPACYLLAPAACASPLLR